MLSDRPRYALHALSALIIATLLIGSAQPALAQCDDLPGCVLVWSDEFDGTEVDLSPSGPSSSATAARSVCRVAGATTSCSTTRPRTRRSPAAS